MPCVFVNICIRTLASGVARLLWIHRIIPSHDDDRHSARRWPAAKSAHYLRELVPSTIIM